MGRGPKPAKGKAKAAVPRKSGKNEDSKVRDLEKRLQIRDGELAEALEQQKATAEILRVISSSPTDVRPVFSAVARSAARLCEAQYAGIALVEEGNLVIPDLDDYGVPPEQGHFLRRLGRIPISSDLAAGRAVIEGTVQHVDDVLADGPPRDHAAEQIQRALGFRTFLAVPMRRGSARIGVIVAWRTEPRPFTATQIELLKTFADQAVIAIENVRLFNETKEALGRQTATAEILRVIASSPTELQPALDAIATNAALVCDAYDAVVLLLEGDRVRYAAHYGPITITLQRTALSRDSITEAAILDRQPVHVHDVLATEPPAFALTAKAAREGGFRTTLSVPLLRENEAIGALAIRRREVEPFTAQQIELLKTFADQAVIAIENVRLFKELQERTGELTRSVEKLTALGQVSQAVNSTLDLEVVLDTITERARELAGADGGAIYEYDAVNKQFHLRATQNVDATLIQALRATPLRKGEGVMGRATETREPIQIGDIAAPGVYESHLRDVLIGAGYRALLSVPIVREGQIIGCLSLNRKAPGEFPPELIDVLKTFATQSDLAIQNARLFRELARKGRQHAASSQPRSHEHTAERQSRTYSS
jgi:GAF domain-containing protein